MFLKKLKIGSVELENNLILAPMAGVTDEPFRKITKKYGNPGLVCNEMVSAKAICYEDEKTRLMLKSENEHPISMQIFGSEPESMGKAAKEVSKLCDILDINMGCPAPKVVKNGDGSKLLTDLGLAKSVIQAVVQNSSKPVSLKIRKGWSNENLVYKEISKIAEEEGIQMIVVHGRTRQEFYSGQSDWNAIKEVKELVSIPVIASGDIIDEESALKCFEQTGCDGLMIGRASLGNPWIFARIAHFLETGEKLPAISEEEKIRVLKEHFESLLKEKSEYTATREIRKFVAWYVKGMPDARRFKEKMNTIETVDSFYQIFD